MPAKILVVDDDPHIRKLMQTSLIGAGFSVRVAENGRVALKLLRDEPADLVVTDILMPEMEGMETITAMKTGLKSPRILAISGGGVVVGREFLTWAKHLGADDILRKPFRMTELVDAVRTLLAVEVGAKSPLRLVSASAGETAADETSHPPMPRCAHG